ncbi:MAG: putative bifunctional diguanylate cyclase/phosphodiesterase [Desulfovibrionaceae bacterium]
MENASQLDAFVQAYDGGIYLCSTDHQLEFVKHPVTDSRFRRRGDRCYHIVFGREAPCPWCGLGDVQEGKSISREVHLPEEDRWLSLSTTPMRHSDKRVSALTLIRDITSDRRAQHELQALRRQYEQVAENPHGCECWYDANGALTYMSPFCERITGYSAESFVKSPELVETIIHKSDLSRWRAFLKQPSYADDNTLDIRMFRKDGRMCWVSLAGQDIRDAEGVPIGARFGLRDITENKVMELHFRTQEFHDSLTGLANRMLCLDRIQQAMERSRRREHYYFAVIVMDLDRFKVINGSLGHAFGDKCLVEVAQRLNGVVRKLDTVARHGGDEFVLLLDELEVQAEAIRVVKRIRAVLREPFQIDGHEVHISASYGIVISPTNQRSPEDLIQNADLALHRAKEAGRNRLKAFTSRMLEQAIDLMSLENDMRRGIARNEFFVQFQPIVAMEGNTLNGFEALVRWRHPRKGVIGPMEFIPLAEETGLILDLGQWILRHACEAMVDWRAKYPGAEDVVMSVNLSGKQFSQPDLVEMIAAVLADTGLPAERLKLEITETAIMDNLDTALGMLKRIKLLGVQLSIDDFGTGYCSLAYLQRFSVNTLKIDRSFINNIVQNQENVEIVRAVVALAHSLNLEVIAEGVEEEAQLLLLRDLRCESVQGYYFSKPLHGKDAMALMADVAFKQWEKENATGLAV